LDMTYMSNSRFAARWPSAAGPHRNRLDLALAVRAGIDRAGGGQQIAGPWQWIRAQVGAHIDHRDSRRGDPIAAQQDKMRIAVAVGIHALDVGDPPRGLLALHEVRGAANAGQLSLRPRRGLLLALGVCPLAAGPRIAALPAAAGEEDEAGGGDRRCDHRPSREATI
jgi:hypothetical protein